MKGQSLMFRILCQMLKRNYTQIDKEAVALVFTVQMFHTYLYGRKFVLVTNYKPLVTLLGIKKAIPPLAAARLQRWAISYQHILEYEIEYKSTQCHANADSLSCLPLKVTDNLLDEVNIFNIAQVEAMPVTAEQGTTTTKKYPSTFEPSVLLHSVRMAYRGG